MLNKSFKNFQARLMSDEPIVQNKSHWTLVVVVLILILLFFVAFWYVKQMDFRFIPRDYNISEIPSSETRSGTETQQIENDVESIDLGDLDSEFDSIDSDLNTL